MLLEDAGYEAVDVADAEKAKQVLRDRHDIRLLELPEHGSFFAKPYSNDQLLNLVAEKLA